VQIHARRSAAAEALARDLAGTGDVVAVAELPDPVGGVIVNCTPVGALVDPEGMPLPASRLLDVRVVVDLAYRADATPTPLIMAAAEAGCAVVDGLEILARQGAHALEIWTGATAPLETMLAAARGT
jgi:shikimate dehydrogenase